MKKLVSVLEVLLAVIFIFISLLLFLLINPTGRDWAINLHEGYIIQSSNAEEQSLIRWTKEREEKVRPEFGPEVEPANRALLVVAEHGRS